MTPLHCRWITDNTFGDVSSEEISTNVRKLISDHIESVVQVEVLLLLHAQSSHPVDAREVATQLRVDPAWAQAQLDNLCQRGLLQCSNSTARQYHYQPQSADLDAAVAGLAHAYADRRVSVINLIYSRPADPIRNFADAFRLRKASGAKRGTDCS